MWPAGTQLEASKRSLGPSVRGVRLENERMEWRLWQAGEVEVQATDISPLLESWEKSTHHAQVRLQSYLDDLLVRLSPLPDDGPLFLHLDVDVQEPRRLSRGYDLENYLTPLFGARRLPSRRFFLVSARKYVGGGSRIVCGRAIPAAPSAQDDWTGITIDAGRGPSEKAWKERLRAELESSGTAALSPGPARVRLAWRCGAGRSWCNLWKPTGDAMGPVLGVSDPTRPYHLDDDRIVDLELHRNVDDALGHDIVVGMWWRSA